MGVVSCQREEWRTGGLARSLRLSIENLDFPSSRKDRRTVEDGVGVVRAVYDRKSLPGDLWLDKVSGVCLDEDSTGKETFVFWGCGKDTWWYRQGDL